MTAAWTIYLLVAGTLLAFGARAAASALGTAGRSTRWAWAAALAGVLALGAVAPRARSFGIVAATSTTGAHAMSGQTSSSRPDVGELVVAARGAIESTVARAITSVSARVPSYAPRALAFAWGLASAVLLALYLVVSLRISRARRRWPRERLHGMDVRVAPSAGPAVIGVVRAEIVVPRALLERKPEEQRWILTHEHEHLRARDNVLLGLACVAVIALPWHPAVWYLLARLRLAIELDCDARVLRRGAPARSYGALLIDMAAHGAGMRVGALARADRPSHLERRLMAMRNSRSRYALARAGGSCAVAALLVMAACEAKVPTSAELSSMGVGDLQKSAAQSGTFSDARFANADLFLDGVKVSSAELLAFDAARIGSMEVVKGARDTVIVTSKERLAQLEAADTAHMKRRSAGSVVATQDGREARTMMRTPGGPGSHPALMVDGTLVTEKIFAALRPEEIATVNVLKPGGGALVDNTAYPNGLIVVETKAHQPMRSKAPDSFRSMEMRSEAGIRHRVRQSDSTKSR
jgi:hypothetical protein